MSESKVLEDRIRAAIRLSRLTVNALDDDDLQILWSLFPDLVRAAREYEELDRLARTKP